jgi:hypothetical protein
MVREGLSALGSRDRNHERDNPCEVAASQLFAAEIQFALKEYKQAEAFATQALELSENINLRLSRQLLDVVSAKREQNLAVQPKMLNWFAREIAGALEIGLRPRVTYTADLKEATN